MIKYKRVPNNRSKLYIAEKAVKSKNLTDNTLRTVRTTSVVNNDERVKLNLNGLNHSLKTIYAPIAEKIAVRAAHKTAPTRQIVDKPKVNVLSLEGGKN